MSWSASSSAGSAGMMSTPAMTNRSATLMIAHCVVMKSRTPPKRTRSIMFDSAPPSTSARDPRGQAEAEPERHDHDDEDAEDGDRSRR